MKTRIILETLEMKLASIGLVAISSALVFWLFVMDLGLWIKVFIFLFPLWFFLEGLLKVTSIELTNEFIRLRQGYIVRELEISNSDVIRIKIIYQNTIYGIGRFIIFTETKKITLPLNAAWASVEMLVEDLEKYGFQVNWIKASRRKP